MKYCAHCGAEMVDEAVICTKCGCAVDRVKSPYMKVADSDKYNTLAIVGFVLSFISSIIGLILSIIAYRQIKETGEKGNGLALAGIIISSIITAIYAILLLFYIGTLLMFFLPLLYLL